MSSEKIAYSREEAARAVGVSVYKVRAAIRENVLPAKKHGKDVVILAADLREWVDGWDSA